MNINLSERMAKRTSTSKRVSKQLEKTEKVWEIRIWVHGELRPYRFKDSYQNDNIYANGENVRVRVDRIEVPKFSRMGVQ